MELNKIANEIVNEYLARELKEAYDQFSPASRRLALQWRRPSFRRMAPLGCSRAAALG